MSAASLAFLDHRHRHLAQPLHQLGIVGQQLKQLVRASQARRAWGLMALAAVGGIVLAMFVHSLFYSGFFEDPITWLALGIAANIVAQRRVEPG